MTRTAVTTAPWRVLGLGSGGGAGVVAAPDRTGLGTAGGTQRTATRILASRVAFAVPAGVLVAAAWKLRIWQARLSAPQYPKGLRLSASGSGVVGDIAEINELNHYVGMKAFSAADAPEMRLWLPVIVMALLAVVVATVSARRGWLARLARLSLWLVPVGALLDVQLRLYQYGHSVQPDAAIRVDPFTPLVVGSTKVLNFTTFAYPGEALWCLLGAAYLLSFGPWTVRRLRAWVATWREPDHTAAAPSTG